MYSAQRRSEWKQKQKQLNEVKTKLQNMNQANELSIYKNTFNTFAALTPIAQRNCVILFDYILCMQFIYFQTSSILILYSSNLKVLN